MEIANENFQKIYWKGNKNFRTNWSQKIISRKIGGGIKRMKNLAWICYRYYILASFFVELLFLHQFYRIIILNTIFEKMFLEEFLVPLQFYEISFKLILILFSLQFFWNFHPASIFHSMRFYGAKIIRWKIDLFYLSTSSTSTQLELFHQSSQNG